MTHSMMTTQVPAPMPVGNIRRGVGFFFPQMEVLMYPSSFNRMLYAVVVIALVTLYFDLMVWRP